MAARVLFLCNMNAVRSPMAAALFAAYGPSGSAVDSAGLYENDYVDPFVGAVLSEIDAPFAPHAPKTIDSLDLGAFDVAIALTEEAGEAARARMPAAAVEVWETANPSDARGGGREEVLEAYRAVRDELRGRIEKRFPGRRAP